MIEIKWHFREINFCFTLDSKSQTTTLTTLSLSTIALMESDIWWHWNRLRMRLEQAWWQCFICQIKGKAISMNKETATVNGRFKNNGIIANESFNEGRQSLSELATSEQNKKHHVWLLIWFYSVIPRNLRLQAKTIFFFYTKERSNFKIKHNGRNVLTNDELCKPWNLQKKIKKCLFIFYKWVSHQFNLLTL